MEMDGLIQKHISSTQSVAFLAYILQSLQHGNGVEVF